MKTSLQSFFDKVVSFRSGSPLWTEDELRSLVESSDNQSPLPRRQPSMLWKIMVPGLVLITAGAAYFYSSINSPQADQNTKQQIRAEATQSTKIDEQPGNTAQSIAQTETSTVVNQKIHAPLHIEGINAIDLTNDELEELGIHQTKEGGYSLTTKLGIEYKNPASLKAIAFMSNQPNRRAAVEFRSESIKSIVEKLGGQVSPTFGVLKIAVSIDTFGINSKVINNSSDEQKEVYPLVITHQSIDPSGERKSQVQFFGDQKDSLNVPAEYRKEIVGLFDLYSDAPEDKKDIHNFPLIGKLIPVRVTLGNELQNPSSAEIIYWFYPSQAFVNKLPERYKTQILTEVQAIATLDDFKDTKQADTIIEQWMQPNQTGEYKYTDVARSNSGAITISAIGPNPAHDHTTIFYSLTAQRTVSVALYDFSGRLISTLATSGSMSAGEQHEISVNVGHLPSGAYLISLISDRGEQAIQRLIIQN